MKLAAVLLAVAALLAACGGSSSPGDEDAKANFRVYGKAETQRDAAEAELNKAFREISSAAQAHDRAGVMAAVGRGEDAVSTIDTALAVQIEAATALAGYAPIREHGGRLRDALQDTKAGTDLIDQQLAIARRDPFLDDAANLREVQRLSSASVKVAVPAALTRRRAVRAIAEKLGVEPPLDVMFDLPQKTTTSGGG